MAEALGLAASVLCLAQTGWTVAKGLHELADEVGSAGEAIRIFASDFGLFVETTKILGDLFKDLPPVSRRIQSTTEELLEVAMDQVVKPFQNMIIELQPLLVKWKDSPSRMMQLGIRVQWAFSYKRKVLFYHSALNALKGNVSLLLQAMALHGQNPPHVLFILSKSIEDTKISLQDGSRKQVSRLLYPENEAITDGGSVMQEQAFKPRPMIPARTGSKSRDQRQSSTQTALVHIADADTLDDVNEITEYLTGVSIFEPDQINNSEQEREENEELLETVGAIRAVQKKVIKVAEEATTAAAPTLDQTYKATTSSNSSGKTSANSSVVAQEPEVVEFQEIPDTTTPQKQKDKPVVGQRLEPEAVHEPSDIEFQEMPDTIAPQQQRGNFVAGQALEPEVVRSSESIFKLKEVVYLRDSLGSTFEIPCNLIGTWQAMHAFLVTEYAQVTVEDVKKCLPGKSYNQCQRLLHKVQRAIRQGTFTVVHVEDNGDSNVVLIHQWENRVMPGWNLRLHLDDANLEIELRRQANPSYKTIRLAQIAATEAGPGGRSTATRELGNLMLKISDKILG